MCAILLCAAFRNTVYHTPILCLTTQKTVSTGCVINCMQANNACTSFECLLNRVKQRKMSILRKRAAQMVMLIEQGVSTQEMVRQLGCGHRMVSHIYHRYVETSSFTHQPHSGRPQVTTTREDRRLVHLVQQEPFRTLTHLVAQMTIKANFNTSRRTVHRRLQQQGMRSRRLATGPVLSRDHHRRRLDFTRNHKSWTDANWESILFTNESQFCLQTGWLGPLVVAPWRALQARKFHSTVELLGRFHNGMRNNFERCAH